MGMGPTMGLSEGTFVFVVGSGPGERGSELRARVSFSLLLAGEVRVEAEDGGVGKGRGDGFSFLPCLLLCTFLEGIRG